MTSAEIQRSTGISEANREVEPQAALKDVWSRSGSRYRLRAIILLAVNALLFAGVGSFAYWLRTGFRIAPAQEAYWDELTRTFWSVPIAGQSYGGASLGALLLDPISVQQVPMQIPILGLLMAALIAIPILVAMLYRFWASVPFIVVVGMLAVMPWLALTLLLSCVLAVRQPFTTRYRFVSALLALVPVVVYLMLAWAGTTEAVAGTIDPIDRVKFVAPWVLAIVAATFVFAVVLIIAKIVDYRPGAIAPLLAVMFGLPVALFEFHVGRDELYYRLLERRSENHFLDRDASTELDAAVMEAWLHDADPRHTSDSVRAQVETRWLFGLTSDMQPQRSALTRHQVEIVEDCNAFLKYFPDSRYAANVLLIRGRSLDTRVDATAFRRTKWIRFYNDFPSPASRSTWEMLASRSPETLLGAVAMLRLAQLDARNGDMERAMAKLDALLALFEKAQGWGDAPLRPGGRLEQVLARQTPEDSLHISPRRTLVEAHRLRDLLRANRDPLYGFDPLAGSRRETGGLPFGLLDLERRHEQYVENLERLKQAYVHCQAEDNIDLEIALASAPEEVRIERLEALIAAHPDGDAIPEALYRLGVALRALGRAPESDSVLAQLQQAHGRSIWADQAHRYRWAGGSPTDTLGLRLSVNQGAG